LPCINLDPAMRDAIARLPASKFREVANAGIGCDDVLAFWFGESDDITPEPVREAAARSLRDGETFYAHNLGLPELRARLADYGSVWHGALAIERIAVTSSGVNALMLAMQLLVDAGDEVVAVVPLWPNLTAQAQIMGARVRRVALRPVQARWTLNLDELLAAIAKATLHIDTLETRKSDSLDFHDVAVWSVKAALEAAYRAGLAAAKEER